MLNSWENTCNSKDKMKTTEERQYILNEDSGKLKKKTKRSFLQPPSAVRFSLGYEIKDWSAYILWVYIYIYNYECIYIMSVCIYLLKLTYSVNYAQFLFIEFSLMIH